MYETERFDVAERVAVAKARLSEKLSTLAERVDGFREAARPMHIASRPWFLISVGVAVGFWMGFRRPREHTPRVARATARPTLLGAVVREVLIVAAGTATRRYLHDKLAPVTSEP